MGSYSSLTDLYFTTHAEIIYYKNMKNIFETLYNNMKMNIPAFYLIYKYCEFNSNKDASVFSGIVTKILLRILLKRNSKQYFQVEAITP